MADEVPPELGHALDRLVQALDQALDSGAEGKDRVASAVRECAAVARNLGLRPELLITALKPRLTAAASHARRRGRRALFPRSRDFGN